MPQVTRASFLSRFRAGALRGETESGLLVQEQDSRGWGQRLGCPIRVMEKEGAWKNCLENYPIRMRGSEHRPIRAGGGRASSLDVALTGRSRGAAEKTRRSRIGKRQGDGEGAAPGMV